MKIENRQKFLVVLTIATVALYVSINFIIAPLAGWWSARTVQIRDLRAKVKEGELLQKREAGIRSRWADMQTNALPASTSLAEQQLLKAVDNWARNRGVDVTSLMPQWKNDAPDYATLACRVETAGDLGTLSKFIYDLEKGPLALRLDAVEISARDNIGSQMTLGLEINGLALNLHNKK